MTGPMQEPWPPARPRVLLIAEAANPEWVSVPLIGWSLAQALRAVAKVHLVTQIRNRDAILRAGLTEGRDFTAIDSESVARPLYALAERLRGGTGKGWTMVQAFNALAYPHFERLVWREFAARLRAGDFDLVHRITPLSPTIGSPVAAKCHRLGIPFVLGPLNGGVPWPPGFDAERRREREWLSYLRGAYRLLPGRRATLHHAAAILAGSRHTMGEIPQPCRARSFYLPENGIDPGWLAPAPAPVTAAPETAAPAAADAVLRACFIGRLVPYKGPDLLLAAAAPLARAGRMRLDIIGDGPMMPELAAQVAAEGIAAMVHFHGWLDHARVREVAAGARLLALPSVREFGGGAVLEAMALGLAPLVVDYAGPGELVSEGTGFKVPLGSRAQIIAGLGAALDRLAADPDLVAKTGQRAQAMVAARFTWPAKAAQLAQVYDWVLGRRTTPPVFFQATVGQSDAHEKPGLHPVAP